MAESPAAIDAARAVDLSRPTCIGCRHRAAVPGSPVAECRRMPQVWLAPCQVQTPQGLVPIGGWVFPPAVVRCGEYAPGLVPDHV